MMKTDEAISALKKAIELNPEIVQAWSNLTNAYLQNDEVDKAVETGEKMVALAPDFALGQNNLASAYYNKGDYKKAIQHLDKAVELGFEPHPEFLKALEPHR
jgi:tetratricopeptide (TPR) repeat protein